MLKTMSAADTQMSELRDERLPAMPSMLGDTAQEMLAAAVEAYGGRLLKARPSQVTWWPGRSLAVSYDAMVTSGESRRPRPETFVSKTGCDLPTNALFLEQGEQRIAVWRLVDDPLLPGLAAVMDERRCRELADTLEAPAGRIRPRLRAYRPGRRAVVELKASRFRLFAKAVRRDGVEALQARHTVMARHVPVPTSHGWSSDQGLVLLEDMPGVTLRTCLATKRAALPHPRELAGTLDRIPNLGDGKRALCPVEAAASYADLIGRLAPELEPRLDALLEGIRGCGDPGPVVPVHGDFYDAQLMISGPRVTGLLDVDTAAIGHRINDWATFIGHLAVTAEWGTPAIRARVREFGRQVLAVAQRECDPADLRFRAAAVIIGLATGPFRVQTPAWPEETRRRIALAEAWAESAAKAARDEKALTSLSDAPHARARQ